MKHLKGKGQKTEVRKLNSNLVDKAHVSGYLKKIFWPWEQLEELASCLISKRKVKLSVVDEMDYGIKHDIITVLSSSTDRSYFQKFYPYHSQHQVKRR